jgi:hypothetical protein
MLDFLAFLKFPKHGPYTVTDQYYVTFSYVTRWNFEKFTCFLFPLFNIVLGSSLTFLMSQLNWDLSFRFNSGIVNEISNHLIIITSGSTSWLDLYVWLVLQLRIQYIRESSDDELAASGMQHYRAKFDGSKY